eukprot:756719-Hanusia_phi.AAC.2
MIGSDAAGVRHTGWVRAAPGGRPARKFHMIRLGSDFKGRGRAGPGSLRCSGPAGLRAGGPAPESEAQLDSGPAGPGRGPAAAPPRPDSDGFNDPIIVGSDGP